MKSIQLAMTLVLLSGCSSGLQTYKSDMSVYGEKGYACVEVPEVVNKVKEGYGDMKACIVGSAAVIFVPKDTKLD